MTGLLLPGGGPTTFTTDRDDYFTESRRQHNVLMRSKAGLLLRARSSATSARSEMDRALRRAEESVRLFEMGSEPTLPEDTWALAVFSHRLWAEAAIHTLMMLMSDRLPLPHASRRAEQP